ncbi:MAG: hypothetical protein EZS28_041168 [Streblomastix strix]|uniref:Uncharacterized protein n=1 Tax=Streblomastix strix TaxID=222440 RepID=A0A5J4TXT9_9EUKA|nr:MAG: hypothetical protein EZS28_041168 [Streblomastix strix]
MTQWIRKNLNSENCYLSSKKSTNQQNAKDFQVVNNLHVCRGKADQNITNRQDESITITENGLEGLDRTQEADQNPGTNQGPSLGLRPSLGLQCMNHLVNLTKGCKDNWSTLQGQKGEVSSQSQQEQGAGGYRTHQIEGGEMSTYNQPQSLQSSQAQSQLHHMLMSRNLCQPQKAQLCELQNHAGHRFRVISESANLCGWKRSHVLNCGNQAISRQTKEALEREAKLFGQNRNSNRNYYYKSNDKRDSRHDYRSHNK